MKKSSVMIVDDHSVVRIGLAAVINLEKDLAVSCEAESGEEAIQTAGRLKPDLIIMDLVLSGIDGAMATGEILKVSPGSKVLIFTTFGGVNDISRALSAGAKSAVTKNLSNDELLLAIRTTLSGERYLSAEIKQTLKEDNGEIQLTPRQLEVLGLVTRGLSNDNLATLLNISKSRVKQHLNELYEKLGAANRAEAVSIALRRQLLKM